MRFTCQFCVPTIFLAYLDIITVLTRTPFYEILLCLLGNNIYSTFMGEICFSLKGRDGTKVQGWATYQPQKVEM